MAKFDALLGGVRSDAQVIAAFKRGRAVGGMMPARVRRLLQMMVVFIAPVEDSTGDNVVVSVKGFINAKDTVSLVVEVCTCTCQNCAPCHLPCHL